MSSPLRWFRRHQKGMLIFFGVGLMAVFGLGTVFTSLGSNLAQGGRDNPVVATWKGGEFTKQDLSSMVNMHFQAVRFTNALQETARSQKPDNFRPMAGPVRAVIGRGQSYNEEFVFEAMINKVLLAEKAKEEGVIIGDGFIDDYLSMVAGNVEFSRNDFERIHAEANQVSGGMQQLREYLKVELAAQQMNTMLMAGLPLIPNFGDSVEIYDKTRTRIACEIYPVEVDTDAITESPSSSEMRQLFDEGKYMFSDPRGLEPGFKINKRVRVNYLYADMNVYMENAKNSFSDAEVQAEYERLVEENSPIVTEVVPLEEPGDQGGPDITAPGGEEAPEAFENADPDAAPAPPGDSLVPDDPAPEISGAGEGADGEASDEESADTNSDEGSQDEGNSSDENEGEEGGLTAVTLGTGGSYVALQEEEEETAPQEESEVAGQEEVAQEEPASEETAADEPGEAGQADEPMEGDAASDENQTEAQGEAEAQGEQTETPGLDTAESRGDLRQVPDTQLPGIADSPSIERRVLPLSECEDKVRESMARDKAREMMSKDLDIAEVKLGVFRGRYIKWNLADESDRGEEPTFDYRTELSDTALIFGETDMVDDLEILETPVGQVSYVTQIMTARGPQMAFPSLGEQIFDRFEDLSEYDAGRESDIATQNQYLYWLREKADTRVPEMDEVEDDIVEFWRRQKAFEAAVAKAEGIAGSVSETDTLTTLYPADANETGEFSWFNTAMGEPRISDPIGVIGASDEFMNTAFSLGQYEAGVAPNVVRNTVYVIQRTSEPASLQATGEDY
ncbi:MAG: hypothetical protein AAF456_19875, partial [Planctomycetota bacterium]